MRIHIPFFLLIFFLGDPSVLTAQNAPNVPPHLTAEMIKSGMLSLKIKDVWRYQQGDDSARADPNFDDAKWLSIMPDGLRAKSAQSTVNGQFGMARRFRKNGSGTHW
jgi:hypothetical protein